MKAISVLHQPQSVLLTRAGAGRCSAASSPRTPAVRNGFVVNTDPPRSRCHPSPWPPQWVERPTHPRGHPQSPARGLRSGRLVSCPGLVPRTDRGAYRPALPCRRAAPARPVGVHALPLGARRWLGEARRRIHHDALPRLRRPSRTARTRPYRLSRRHNVSSAAADSVRSPEPGTRAVRMGGADDDHSFRPPGRTRVPPPGVARRPDRRPTVAELAEAAVEHYARHYSKHSPQALFDEVHATRSLLAEPLTAFAADTDNGVSRELRRSVGHLSALLGNLAFHLDDFAGARTHLATAHTYGHRIGDHRLSAWVCGARSMVALADDRFGAALYHAEEGLSLAPAKLSRAQLHAWAQLRALARQGREREADEALAAAVRALEADLIGEAPGGSASTRPSGRCTRRRLNSLSAVATWPSPERSVPRRRPCPALPVGRLPRSPSPAPKPSPTLGLPPPARRMSSTASRPPGCARRPGNA